MPPRAVAVMLSAIDSTCNTRSLGTECWTLIDKRHTINISLVIRLASSASARNAAHGLTTLLRGCTQTDSVLDSLHVCVWKEFFSLYDVLLFGRLECLRRVDVESENKSTPQVQDKRNVFVARQFFFAWRKRQRGAGKGSGRSSSDDETCWTIRSSCLNIIVDKVQRP